MGQLWDLFTNTKMTYYEINWVPDHWYSLPWINSCVHHGSPSCHESDPCWGWLVRSGLRDYIDCHEIDEVAFQRFYKILQQKFQQCFMWSARHSTLGCMTLNSPASLIKCNFTEISSPSKFSIASHKTWAGALGTRLCIPVGCQCDNRVYSSSAQLVSRVHVFSLVYNSC